MSDLMVSRAYPRTSPAEAEGQAVPLAAMLQGLQKSRQRLPIVQFDFPRWRDNRSLSCAYCCGVISIHRLQHT